jgi:hypothetical protein
MSSKDNSLPFNQPIDVTKVSKILISAPGYESVEKIPYKGDGTLKSDLGVIKLQPLQKSLELDQIESSQLKTSQIDSLSATNKTPEYFIQKRLTGLIVSLTGTIIPLLLKQCAQFGLTNLSKMMVDGKLNTDSLKDSATCPSTEEINRIIDSKNKLTKQLNNTYNTLNVVSTSLGITQGVITGLQLAYTIGVAIPTPSPSSVTLSLNKTKQILDKLSIANSGILSLIILTQQILSQCLEYMNTLDQLVQKCYPDAEQSAISDELRSIAQQVPPSPQPKSDSLNGFTLSVEMEVTEKPLKRRRAIAKNRSNVVMLKGEWSFSSIDQILIDELVFYIQQNDLKAT